VIVPPLGDRLARDDQTCSTATLRDFFGNSMRGRFQASLVLSPSMKARAMACASSRSICAPAEPAAPNASRQNCRRADAVFALFLMRSRAKFLVSWSLSFHPALQVRSQWHRSTDQVVADPRAQKRRRESSASRATAVVISTSPFGRRFTGNSSVQARLTNPAIAARVYIAAARPAKSRAGK